MGRNLRRMGVGREGRVGICLERGLEMVVAELGVLKAGGAYVPLDVEYPAERKEQLLRDSGARVVVARKGRGVAEVMGVRRVDLEDIEDIEDVKVGKEWGEEKEKDGEERDGEERDEDLGVEVEREGLAYVMYTSGSTGQPKGVMVTHGNVVRLVRKTNYVEFREGLVMGHISNVAFDASTFEIWGALLNGIRLVVMKKWEVLQVEEFRRQLKGLGVTTVFLTTALFQECVRSSEGIFAGMDQVLFGGEACDEQVVRRAVEEGGVREVVHVYGPTESTTFATSMGIRRVEEGKGIAIGRAIGNTRVYVLDKEKEPVPVGVVGEIHIGGGGVGRGYVNHGEMTGERFLPDPDGGDWGGEGREGGREKKEGEGGGERMYGTGDMGRWVKGGVIEFIGRKDHQVKLRGYRIELGEIEAWLGKYEGVKEAVVVVREDEGGEKRLVAYYTVGGGDGEGKEGKVGKEDKVEKEEKVGAEELWGYLRVRLPEYMVPWAYVRLEKLPLTENGKVDRKGLPAPEGDAYAERQYEAPEGEMEELVAGIWGEVVKLERVGRHDNFFEMGGHSLLAVRVVT